jgi:hypothetical protein
LLDFGCVVELSQDRAQTLVRLVQRAMSACAQEVLADYLALGFNPDLLEPMSHLLPALNRIIFEPFIAQGPFTFSQWRLGERVEKLLGSFRWNFRFAGPAGLIFLVRAYLGLIRYLHALKLDVDCSRVWRESVGPALQTAPPPPVCEPDPARPVLSRHLRVAVWDKGVARVNLTFKAILAESLADLIPDELGERLVARGLDVQRIASEAALRRFAPGELFHLEEASKLVKVWLE